MGDVVIGVEVAKAGRTTTPDVVEDIAAATGVSAEDVQKALEEVQDIYGEEEVAEGLAALAEREVPTGEGLTKREAQHLLVAEMNAGIQRRNQKALRSHKAKVDAWYKNKSEGNKTGQYPRDPIFIKGFDGIRHLDQAVSMARQRSAYKPLLEAAGFGFRRKR